MADYRLGIIIELTDYESHKKIQGELLITEGNMDALLSMKFGKATDRLVQKVLYRQMQANLDQASSNG